MNKLIIRVLKIFFILIILFHFFNIAVPIPIASSSSNKLSDLISFNSYFEIDYNSSIFEGELSLNKSYNLPIVITYKSDITEEFLNRTHPFNNKIAPLKANDLLFGTAMLQQTINISIMNKDEISWAQVNLTGTKIMVDIPVKNDDIKIRTSLILSPLEEAPAQFNHIKIRIESRDLGILKGQIFDANIEFKPKYKPMIDIYLKNSTQLTTPNQPVNFDIKIKNYSNKMIRINSKILSNKTSWNPIINPQFIDISPDENRSFVFSVMSPDDFGWLDSIEDFNVTFSTISFPIKDNSTIDETYEVNLKVKNYGFSTPGFEMIGLILAILSITLVKKRLKK